MFTLLKPLGVVLGTVLLGAACGGEGSKDRWKSDECAEQIAVAYEIDDEVAASRVPPIEADAALGEAILEVDAGTRHRFVQAWEDSERQEMWSAAAAVRSDPAWVGVEQSAAAARELSDEANAFALEQANNWRNHGHLDLFAACIGGDLQEYEEAVARWIAAEMREIEEDHSVGGRTFEDLREDESFVTPPWVATEEEDHSISQDEAEQVQFVLTLNEVDLAIASWETPMPMIWLDAYDCLKEPDHCQAGKSAPHWQDVLSALSKTTP